MICNTETLKEYRIPHTPYYCGVWLFPRCVGYRSDAVTSSAEKLTPMGQLSLNLIQKLYLSKTTILMCVISPSSSQGQAKLSVKFTVKYLLCCC